MNKILEKQLANVKVADLSNYDEETATYFIPKFNQVMLEVDNCYLIKLKTRIPSDSNLTINLNRGTSPKYLCLKIDVQKVTGKLIYVNSLGYDEETQTDINEMWSGWLSTDLFDVISKI